MPIANPTLKRWLLKTAAPGVIAVVVLGLDYVTGPRIVFPITFVVPVALAAWQGARVQACLLAVVLPLTRFWFSYLLNEDLDSAVFESINTAIRIGMLLMVALLVRRVATKQEALEKEVRVLEGMLPVCAYCKKVRDENGQWHPIELYITRHSEATFAKTFCADCCKEHWEDPQPVTKA